MRRAVLAWEGGAGRGHITSLRTIAEAIGDRFSFDAALCVQRHAGELADLCDTVLPVPPLVVTRPERRPEGTPPPTWGEYLGDIGFADRDTLVRRVTGWQRLMRDRDISLVIADFSPFALLAARGLGIAAVSSGVGYFTPPPTLERYPLQIEGESPFLHDEAQLVALVNETCGELGVPRIRHLPEVYLCDETLVLSPPFLDPYAGLRPRSHVPPAADVASAIVPPGDEVYGYFSTSETRHEAIVEGVIAARLPTRLFIPDIEDGLAARLGAAGIAVERAPVPVDEIARRSRLILNAGQHGILCLALAAGRAQVTFPQHIEHLHNARQVARAGAGVLLTRGEWTVQTVAASIRSAYADASLQARAMAFGTTLRSFFEQNRRVQIRRRLTMV